MPRRSKDSKSRRDHLLKQAVQQLAGPAIILDANLKIVAGTPTADALFGGPLPIGQTAPQVLCGQADRRPIAEALARGESAQAEILRPSSKGEQVIGVKTLTLSEGGVLIGHVLLLTPQGEAVDGVSEIHGVLTASETMRSLLRKVERVARSEASVLVRGETGSGKELIARALHDLSPRSSAPFAAINCAALPPELLESELFGHIRGAFTGAVKDTPGLFRSADGGSVFLDEIGELPLSMQAKLLRVIQERTVLPVGGNKPIAVNVRLISATHRSLRREVSEGRFRADLMYRLRVIPLYLPALRERRSDIEPLVRKFIERLNAGSKERSIERISPDALRALSNHFWPGNVRELENVVQYAFLLGEGPVLAESDLPEEVRDGREPTDRAQETEPPDALPAEARRISRALERAGGNRGRAAQSLGMSRSTLWRRMRQYGQKDER